MFLHIVIYRQKQSNKTFLDFYLGKNSPLEKECRIILEPDTSCLSFYMLFLYLKKSFKLEEIRKLGSLQRTRCLLILYLILLLNSPRIFN